MVLTKGSCRCSLYSFLLSVLSDVPVMDDTLTRVTVIGLSPELPVDAPKALKFVETLVQRAAGVKSGMLPAIKVIESTCYL